jgi:hypothetical protein
LPELKSDRNFSSFVWTDSLAVISAMNTQDRRIENALAINAVQSALFIRIAMVMWMKTFSR